MQPSALIVHVGAGKAGSTAIQRMLARSGAALARQGARFLGLCLENAPGPRAFGWQRAADTHPMLRHLREPDGTAQVADWLERQLAGLASEGVARAFWSNETFLAEPETVGALLARLAERGIDVRVEAYVRRYDAWLRSAYEQWAVRHKPNRGPVRPFRVWAAGGSGAMGAHLARYEALLPGRVQAFNYDAAGDVCAHFARRNGLEGLPRVEPNPSPEPAALAAWAVFNSRSGKPMQPSAYPRFLASFGGRAGGRPTPPDLGDIFPDEADLAEAVAARAEDIGIINDLLRRCGEPELDHASPPSSPRWPDGWEIDRHLLGLVFDLAEEVARLREAVEAGEKGAGAPDDEEGD